jgi:Protein of unknown function (DUF3102)
MATPAGKAGAADADYTDEIGKSVYDAPGARVQALNLPDLAAKIEAEHQAAHQAARTALEHALECGKLLLQAKASVPHGGWLPWVEDNLSFGPRQAQKYMRLADHAAAISNTTSESHLTIEGALAAIAEPKAGDMPAIEDALTVLKAHGVRRTVLDELLDLGCVVTPVSLTLPKGLAFEDWLRIGEQLPNLERDQVALHDYGQKLLDCADRLKPFQDKIRAAAEAGEAMPDFAESVYEQTCELVACGARWRAACAKTTLAIANARLNHAVEAKLRAQRQAVVLAADAGPQP